MESENIGQDSTVKEKDCPNAVLKKTCLSNGTSDSESQEQIAEVNVSSIVVPANESTCNGKMEVEVSCESEGSDVTEDSQIDTTSAITTCTDKENVQTMDISETTEENISVNKVNESASSRDASETVPASSNRDGDSSDFKAGQEVFEEELDDNCDMDSDDNQNVKATQNEGETNSQACSISKSDIENESLSTSSERKSSVPTLDPQLVELSESKDSKDSDNESNSSQGAIRIVDIKSSYNVSETFDNVEDSEDDDVTCLEVEEISGNNEKPKNTVRRMGNTDNRGIKNLFKAGSNITDSEVQNGFSKGKESADYEMCNSAANGLKLNNKSQKINLLKNNVEKNKDEKSADSSADEVEIIGESKVIHANNKLDTSHKSSKNVAIVPGRSALLRPGLPVTGNPQRNAASKHVPPAAASSSPALLPRFIPGGGAQRFPMKPAGFTMTGGVPGQSSQKVPSFVPSVAPPKPKSSLDQIELIRWEIQNRINCRPKYFKPSPSSDLGPLAKYLFDIGSDLIKEAVYHDLVKIQSRKNNNDKLSPKEKEDLTKLKKIEKDLFATIGHLKLKLKKRCRVCKYQTESDNVMFYHKQYPHEDNKFMRCSHCSFVTKQTLTFKSHMETDHSMQGKLHDKKAIFECDLCPYENNQEQKVTLHKQRCIKQYRPLFNLHPSCLSGAEINLCLENIFYKPIIPKNLKILQQKYAQQQAALTEAKRQQAQIQEVAAQKKIAALSAKKPQQLPQKGVSSFVAARFNAPTNVRMQNQQQAVPYNASSNVKAVLPTVANMLKNKQKSQITPTGSQQNTAVAGFEACEICGGYVKDKKALRIHFFYAHRIDLPVNLFECYQPPLYCATCYVRFWTAQGLRKHIDTHKEENQTRGVVGKCISCGHRVLNLLLHMRVVHNREMQHYMKALMCMFCGGCFESRQECERHITQVHGQVDPVSGALKSSTTPAQKAQLTPAKAGNNSLVKGSICVLCNLNFGRNVDLTRHCMRMHHTCMKCGMVVIDKASLIKHTCLCSPSGTRDCTVCGETGFHPAYYVKHLRDKHLKKLTISMVRLSTETIERWTKCLPSNETPPEILVEILDSDDEVDDDAANKSILLPDKTPSEQPNLESLPVKTTTEQPNIESLADKTTSEQPNIESLPSKTTTEQPNIESLPDKTASEQPNIKSLPVETTSEEPDIELTCEVESPPVEDTDNTNQDDSVEMVVDDAKEVIDIDSALEISSADEDSKSNDISRGEKRKSESPTSEESSKRKKLS